MACITRKQIKMLNDFYKFFRISESDISSLQGKVKIFHSEVSDGNYSFLGEEILIECAFPRAISAKEVNVSFFDGYNGKNTCIVSGEFKRSDFFFDYFIFSLKSPKKAGLYFFYFEILNCGKIYGCKLKNNIISFSFLEPCEKNQFQITVTTEKSREKIQGIIYHIFVDRFRRSRNTALKKNAILIEDWNSNITEYPKYPGAFLKNNSFFGGNLYGIIEKLDYLCELGVSIIYLSPIFESPSNHKYDTSDYENVDVAFGGNEAFEELIKEAERRNIKIILDGVFNHTGADSKYFNKYSNYDTVGAFQSKESPYYSWYKFKDYPEKYECWWGIDILPRIFYENSDAEKYFVATDGIIEKWMKKGAYGFRLDVADELSDTFIRKIRDIISKANPNALLYGEVWEDASNKIAYGVRKKYYLGDELCGVMNYPLREGIVDYIRNKNCSSIDYVLNEVMLNMPKAIREKTMNILGSHDTVRIISALSCENVSSKTNDELSTFKMKSDDYEIAKRRVIAAYTIITALPGIPTVYYGDEAGVEGYKDPFNRRTFPWGSEDTEILNHFKKCAIIRKSNPILFDGEFNLLCLNKEILIFERKKEAECLFLIYNNTKKLLNINTDSAVMEILNGRKGNCFVLEAESAHIFKSYKKVTFKIGCYIE